MSWVKIKKISKQFSLKGPSVIDSLELLIQEGEFTALIGDSGSGKTTILRMIAGLETPSSGEIYLRDKIVFNSTTNMGPEHRNVSLVFQDYALFPHLNVKENIYFGLHGQSKEIKIECFSEVITLLNLQGLEKRYPHELSGGQVQRVAIARALARKPDLLLLDEPFNNLDFSLKNAIMEEIKDILTETNTTTILVTHDRNEAFLLADKIAVLKEGKILQLDDAYTIYHKPVNPYTAKFFGKANFIKGKRTEKGISTALGVFPDDLFADNNNKEITLVLKPEDFLVKKTRDSIECTVKNIRFFGNYKELVVIVPGLENDITINVDHHINPKKSEKIWILPDKEDVWYI